MNINALLSHDVEDDSAGGKRESPEVSPQKKPSRGVRPGGKRTHSALSQEITRSPDRQGESSPQEEQQQQQQYQQSHQHQQTLGPARQAPTSYPVSESQASPQTSARAAYGHPLVAHRPSNPSTETTAGEFFHVCIYV